MRFFISLSLITIIFYSCDKISDSIIDPVNTSMTGRIISANIPDSVVYTSLDSVITVSLQIDDPSDIAGITLNLISPNSINLISSKQLFDDGDITNHGDSTSSDNIYSTLIPFSKNWSNGIYSMEFSFQFTNNIKQNVAIGYLFYLNSDERYAPYIFNLNAPDTLFLGTAIITALMSIEAADSNGQADIQMVYFQSFRPDSTTSGNLFELFDDGTTEHGDDLAGDGVYSIIIQLPPNAMAGEWRFDFQAIDKTDSLSNVISHDIDIL